MSIKGADYAHKLAWPHLKCFVITRSLLLQEPQLNDHWLVFKIYQKSAAGLIRPVLIIGDCVYAPDYNQTSSYLNWQLPPGMNIGHRHHIIYLRIVHNFLVEAFFDWKNWEFPFPPSFFLPNGFAVCTFCWFMRGI